MFTGIITETGTLAASRSEGGKLILSIGAPGTAAELKPGASVSVNGICLTATAVAGGRFEVEAVEETLRKSALEKQLARRRFNLELPMKADGRFDGHLVLGHVDGTGSIRLVEQREGSRVYGVRHSAEFGKYLVRTGSVALDGVSLTVASLADGEFTVSIIPFTLENTIFGDYADGEEVNLEADIIGKYIERMSALGSQFPPRGGGRSGGISIEELKKHGF